MHDAYEKATKHVHQQMGQRLAGSCLTAEQHAKRKEMLDPLAAMEAGLVRINRVLAHEVVRPDIQGWQQSQPQVAARQHSQSDFQGRTLSPGAAARRQANSMSGPWPSASSAPRQAAPVQPSPASQARGLVMV